MATRTDPASASNSKNPGRRKSTSSPTQSHGSADGTTFNQSDALSFASFRKGEVDPRTGTFNYRIPIARLTGNARMGPSVELFLRYNHFTDEDEGFGNGWTMGLSKLTYNNSRRQVLLRDGRLINLTYDDASSTFSVDTRDIKDFIFRKNESGDYEILYKDGVTETLGSVGAERCVTQITHENGYRLFVEYDGTKTPAYLTRIYDESGQNLLDISRTDTTDPDSGTEKVVSRVCVIDLFAGDANCASKVTLAISDDGTTGFTLRSCDVNLDEASAINTVGLTYIGADPPVGFRVIKSVTSNYAGQATETMFYGPMLKIPPGAPWNSIPAVTSYSFSVASAGTGVEKNEVHTYTYGDEAKEDFRNFLGYNDDSPWDPNAIDNIYNRDGGYRYLSTEKLAVDGIEIHTIKRTYEKFHRLVEEFLSIPDSETSTGREITNTYFYDKGASSDLYASLPPQYKLSTQADITYKETYSEAATERTRSQKFSYDAYGNLLAENQTGGMSAAYEYYPAEGEAAKCPAEKNGFIRYVKSVKKYKTDVTVDSVTTLHTYTSTQNKGNAGAADSVYTVPLQEKETKIISGTESSDSRITDYSYFPDSTDQGDDRGRLKSVTLQLGEIKGATASFKYVLSIDNKTLKTTTTETGVKGSIFTESKTVSSLTGQPVEIIDNFGIATTLAYDTLGRMTSFTRAPATPYERKVTCSYGFDAATGVHTKTTNEPSVNVVTTTSDAFGNVVKEEVGGQIARVAEYNTQGLRVIEHRYDYDVPAADGTQMQLDLADTYTYDAFGNLAVAKYHDGLAHYRRFNIGSAALTEYTTADIEAEDVAYFNYTVTKHDAVTMLPLQVTEYDMDGLTPLAETWYSYDEFLRVGSVKVVDAVTQAQTRVGLDYDFFNRISKSVEYDGETVGRTTTIAYWSGGLEPKVTSLSVDGVVVATRMYDDLGRLTQVDRNPAAASRFLTQYEYDPGYTAPKKITTPRGIVVDYTYCPELGGVPTGITPPATDGGSFSYGYDSALVKLISETCTAASGPQGRTIAYDANALISSETVTAQGSDGVSANYTNAFSRTTLGTLRSVTATVGSYPSAEVKYGYDNAGRVSGIAFSRSGKIGLKLGLTYLVGELLDSATYEFTKPDNSTATFQLMQTYDEKMRVAGKTYQYKNGEAFEDLAHSEVTYNGLGQVCEQYVQSTVDRSTGILHVFDYLGRLISSTADDSTTVYPKDFSGNDVNLYTFAYDQYDNMVTSTTKARETGEVTTTQYNYLGKNVFEMTNQVTLKGGKFLQCDVGFDNSGNVNSLTKPDGTVTTCVYDGYEKLREYGTAKPGDASWPATSIGFGPNSQGKIQLEKQTVTQDEVTNVSQVSASGYCNGVFDATLRKQSPTDSSVQFASYLHGAAGIDATTLLQGNAKDGYTTSQSLLLSDVSGSVYGKVSADTTASPDVTPWIYSPYGYAGVVSQTSHDAVRFKGARHDPLVNLYHLGDGTRAYDSDLLMRFYQYDSESPFGEGGLNPYAYCAGDPVTFFDPSGRNRALKLEPILISVVGFLLGVASFGLGGFALVGGGFAFLSAVQFLGGVLGLAGGALSTAAAVTSDDEDAALLTNSSYVLDSLSLLLGIFPVSLYAAHLVTHRLIARLSSARVLSYKTSVAKAYPGSDFTVSRRISAPGTGGNVRVVSTHGAQGVLAIPVENPNFLATGVRTYIDKPVLVEEAAEFIQKLLRDEFGDSDGPIFLVACGGTRAGAINNAQTVANYTRRTVSAFPTPTAVAAFKRLPPNLAAANSGTTRFTTWGAYWFPRAMEFSPG
jgi:RHS repeat-associated protein